MTIRGCERCGNPTPSGRHRYCEECGFARYVERQRRTDRWASLETLRVAYARRKATKTSREYGTRHQKLRERWRPQVEAGQVTCWRCGKLIRPGQAWDLGHDDTDRSRYRGPEHARENRQAGGRQGNARQAARRRQPGTPVPGPRYSRVW